MKKIFLMGRSEAGKTSLTQALKGEELHYVKTQYTTTEDDTIDSPGEYAESKRFSVGLACFSFEADVVAIVQAADTRSSVRGQQQMFYPAAPDRDYNQDRFPLRQYPHGKAVADQRGMREDFSGEQCYQRGDRRASGLSE